MHYLTVTAIHRWELPWLEEWVEYHRLVGVDHFRLYCNDDDTAASDAILARYIASGLVENIRWVRSERPGYPQQSSLDDAMRWSRGRTKWLCPIDIDEFLLPLKHDSMREVLTGFEGKAALMMNWRVFGTSGHKARPHSQITCFTRRSSDAHPKHRQCKLAVSPALVERLVGPHYPKCVPPHAAVRDDGSATPLFEGGWQPSLAVVNHYYVRSEQDWTEVKFKRGDVWSDRDGLGHFSTDTSLPIEHEEVEDDAIASRFGPEVERRLARRRLL